MRIVGIGLIAIMLAFFPASALGGADEVYQIETFEELEALSLLIAEGSGAYEGEVRLMNDIEALRPLVPLGDERHMFQGLFDGQGHVISGLRIVAGHEFAGLFGFVGREGVVCNLVIRDALISGTRYTGAVAGFSDGTIECCTVEDSRIIGNSRDEYGTATGGIAGLVSGRVTGCISQNGSVYGGRYVGGIAGSLCAGEIRRSLSSGMICSIFEGEALVGGVTGAVQSGGEVRECVGTVEIRAERAFDAGGIAGGAMSGSLSKCIFLGDIWAREPGAIAGYAARRSQIMACLYAADNAPGVGEGRQDGTLPLPMWNMNCMNERYLMSMIREK